MKIRICPQAPESYVFLVPWSKNKLVYQNLSPKGLTPFMYMICQRFLSFHLTISPFSLKANNPRGKEDPPHSISCILLVKLTFVVSLCIPGFL